MTNPPLLPENFYLDNRNYNNSPVFVSQDDYYSIWKSVKTGRWVITFKESIGDEESFSNNYVSEVLYKETSFFDESDPANPSQTVSSLNNFEGTYSSLALEKKENLTFSDFFDLNSTLSVEESTSFEFSPDGKVFASISWEYDQSSFNENAPEGTIFARPIIKVFKYNDTLSEWQRIPDLPLLNLSDDIYYRIFSAGDFYHINPKNLISLSFDEDGNRVAVAFYSSASQLSYAAWYGDRYQDNDAAAHIAVYEYNSYSSLEYGSWNQVGETILVPDDFLANSSVEADAFDGLKPYVQVEINNDGDVVAVGTTSKIEFYNFSLFLDENGETEAFWEKLVDEPIRFFPKVGLLFGNSENDGGGWKWFNKFVFDKSSSLDSGNIIIAASKYKYNQTALEAEFLILKSLTYLGRQILQMGDDIKIDNFNFSALEVFDEDGNLDPIQILDGASHVNDWSASFSTNGESIAIGCNKVRSDTYSNDINDFIGVVRFSGDVYACKPDYSSFNQSTSFLVGDNVSNVPGIYSSNGIGIGGISNLSGVSGKWQVTKIDSTSDYYNSHFGSNVSISPGGDIITSTTSKIYEGESFPTPLDSATTFLYKKYEDFTPTGSGPEGVGMGTYEEKWLNVGKIPYTNNGLTYDPITDTFITSDIISKVDTQISYDGTLRSLVFKNTNEEDIQEDQEFNPGFEVIYHDIYKSKLNFNEATGLNKLYVFNTPGKREFAGSYTSGVFTIGGLNRTGFRNDNYPYRNFYIYKNALPSEWRAVEAVSESGPEYVWYTWLGRQGVEEDPGIYPPTTGWLQGGGNKPPYIANYEPTPAINYGTCPGQQLTYPQYVFQTYSSDLELNGVKFYSGAFLDASGENKALFPSGDPKASIETYLPNENLINKEFFYSQPVNGNRYYLFNKINLTGSSMSDNEWFIARDNGRSGVNPFTFYWKKVSGGSPIQDPVTKQYITGKNNTMTVARGVYRISGLGAYPSLSNITLDINRRYASTPLLQNEIDIESMSTGEGVFLTAINVSNSQVVTTPNVNGGYIVDVYRAEDWKKIGEGSGLNNFASGEGTTFQFSFNASGDIMSVSESIAPQTVPSSRLSGNQLDSSVQLYKYTPSLSGGSGVWSTMNRHYPLTGFGGTYAEAQLSYNGNSALVSRSIIPNWINPTFRSGFVEAFKWNVSMSGGIWEQKGSRVFVANSGVVASQAYSQNQPNGDIFAVASLASTGNFTNSTIKAYRYINSGGGTMSWVQQGSDVLQENMYSKSIAIFDEMVDGTMAITIAVFEKSTDSENIGKLVFHRYDLVGGYEWRRYEALLFNEGESLTNLGIKATINSSLNSVAALYRNSASESVIKVFAKSLDIAGDNEVWYQRGQDIPIIGDTNSLTVSLSLSEEGDVLSVGEPFKDTSSSSSAGSVRIYKYNVLGSDNLWHLADDEIYGRIGETAGSPVTLNAEGNTLAVGNPRISEFNKNGFSVYKQEVGIAKYVGMKYLSGPIYNIVGPRFEISGSVCGQSTVTNPDGTTYIVDDYGWTVVEKNFKFAGLKSCSQNPAGMPANNYFWQLGTPLYAQQGTSLSTQSGPIIDPTNPINPPVYPGAYGFSFNPPQSTFSFRSQTTNSMPSDSGGWLPSGSLGSNINTAAIGLSNILI